MYKIREAVLPADEERIASVWRGIRSQEISLQRDYPAYYRSPFGLPRITLLELAGTSETVGVGAVAARNLAIGSSIIRAGLISHFGVARAHQSLGPAVILARAIIESALLRFAILYGMPNSRASSVFQRLGFRVATSMVRLVMVLQPSKYLSRIGVLKPLHAVSKLIDGTYMTLQRVKGGRKSRYVVERRAAIAQIDLPEFYVGSKLYLSGARSNEFLRYRFPMCEKVLESHYVVRDAETCALMAWFGCDCSSEVPGGLSILDFWFSEMASDASKLIMQFVVAASTDGYVSISLEISDDRSLVEPWKRVGFIPRERESVYVVARDASDEMLCDFRLAFTALDKEV